jgi:hypothetical protein
MNAAHFIILLGSSSNVPYQEALAIWDSYETYVLADSGTVEAKDCTINKLLSTFEFSRATQIFSDYLAYVEADSGSVEAVSCTINALNAIL